MALNGNLQLVSEHELNIRNMIHGNIIMGVLSPVGSRDTRYLPIISIQGRGFQRFYSLGQ